MDSQIKAKLEEFIRIFDHLRREVEETRGYAEHGDLTTALRNQNESRDEVHRLPQKWEELSRLLERR